MKRIILLSILIISFASAFAQNDKDESKKGFKKENLFTGGSITASFYTGGTILGISPMFGYKLANWVDAGVAFNYTYTGTRDYIVFDDKLRQNVFGPGVFARIYPVRFLFLQGQFEHNFTHVKYTDDFGDVTKSTADANSLLLGGGIAEGRRPGSNTFYYLSVLGDVLKNPNSPYVNNVYDGSGQLIRTDLIPIIRAGVNIGLFQGKYNHYDNDKGDGHRRPRNYGSL
ncbi:MAG TPA: hypothetical protein VGI82_09905 [Chitinophagaceae bacterium]